MSDLPVAPDPVRRVRPSVGMTAVAAAVLLALPVAVLAVVGARGVPDAAVRAGPAPDESGESGESGEPEEMVLQAVGRYFSGGGGGFENEWHPLEHLFVRTTGDGVTIRAYLEDVPDENTVQVWSPGWEPPPWCYRIAATQAALSTDASVIRASSSVYAEPPDGLWAERGVFGLREGEPVWWVSAQAAGAATIRARFPGGGTDEMFPADGLAVLAHAAPPVEVGSEDEYWQVYEELMTATVTVEALDADGVVVASRDLRYLAEHDERCDPPPRPPPTLPPPGAEQPADAAAARAGVEQAYADVFTGTNPDDVRMAATERGEELAGAFADLAEGDYAEVAKTATVDVRDVVFVSATEAAVAYQITVESIGDLPPYTGRAVLVDGRWKVTRDTICEVLGLVGVDCHGGDGAEPAGE